MHILHTLKEHKISIFLVCISIIIIGIIIIILQSLFKPTPPVTQPPSPNIISKQLDTRVNHTTDNDVRNLPDLKMVQDTKLGTEYTFKSVSKSIDNVIITRNNKVIFEKKFTSTPEYVHPILSEYLQSLGEPERVIPGSHRYGRDVNYYIYSSIGISIIGRPSSDEIQEIQQYQPMSIEGYINTWGTDIVGEEAVEEKL